MNANVKRFTETGNPAWVRPWLENGKSYVTVAGKNLPSEMDAQHTREWWFDKDKLVDRVVRQKLTMISWAMTNGLGYNPTDRYMSRTILEHEDMTDKQEEVQMDVETPLQPTYTLKSVPLPFTYSDTNIVCEGQFAEEIAASRVCDTLEKCVLNGWVNGTQKVIGLRDERIKTIPLVSDTAKGDVLRARQALMEMQFYGPYQLFTGESFEGLQSSYGITGVNNQIVYSPHLKNGELILFQATPNVFQIVSGQSPVLVQWEEGHTRIISMMVPRLREDYAGNFGVARITR